MIRRLRARVRLTYAIAAFIFNNKLIEYGDDQLADLGGDDE